MKKKSVVLFSVALVLFVLFAAFTVAVSLLDKEVVTYATGEQAEIGFAGINQAVFKAIGENALWYDFTEFLGVIALGVAAIFALVGLYQLLTRKRLFAVDRQILFLALFYILVGCFYVLFEVLVINYRPVLVGGALEASYPSSHSMLAICIFTSAPLASHRLIEGRMPRLAVTVLCALLAALTVVGRLLSGVHWLTDIVGAALLSAALVTLYAGAVAHFKRSRNGKTEK